MSFLQRLLPSIEMGVREAHTLNGSLGSDVSVTLKVTFDL